MRKLLLLTCFAIAACDDSIAIDDLLDELADAQCEFAVRCELVEDAQTCDATNVIAGNEVETTLAGVEDGTIDYDADAARECIDAIREQSCSFGGFHVSDPCDGVFTGTVPPGGACFIDEECANAGNCNPTAQGCDPDTACCPGICEAGPAIAQIGSTCDATTVCADNAYCKRQGQAAGTCTALVTGEGSACDALDSCANPLFCNLDLTGGGMPATCKRPAASGAACSRMDLVACADRRDYCDPMTLTCERGAAVGESCGSGVSCIDYASCEMTTCVADLGPGEACTPSGPSCAGSFDCVNGVCTAPPAGMACR